MLIEVAPFGMHLGSPSAVWIYFESLQFACIDSIWPRRWSDLEAISAEVLFFSWHYLIANPRRTQQLTTKQ